MKHLSLISITALIIAMLCSCESTISESYSDGKDVSVAGKTYRWQRYQEGDEYYEFTQLTFSNDSVYLLYQYRGLVSEDKTSYYQEKDVVFYTFPNDKEETAICYGDFIITNGNTFKLVK